MTPASQSAAALNVDSNSTKEEIERSREIIKREFAGSLGMTTIGLAGAVIAPEDDENFAKRKFQDLISALMEIDPVSPMQVRHFRSCTWILELPGAWHRPKSTANDFKILQGCLEGLNKETKIWLKSRSAFIISCARDRRGLKKSDCFFNSILRNSQWDRNKAVTVFLGVNDQNRLRFFGHIPPHDDNWEEGPVAKELRSEAKKRNSVIRRALKLCVADDSQDLNSKVAMKIKKDGFSIFSFDDFVKLKSSDLQKSK